MAVAESSQARIQMELLHGHRFAPQDSGAAARSLSEQPIGVNATLLDSHRAVLMF